MNWRPSAPRTYGKEQTSESWAAFGGVRVLVDHSVESIEEEIHPVKSTANWIIFVLTEDYFGSIIHRGHLVEKVSKLSEVILSALRNIFDLLMGHIRRRFITVVRMILFLV